MPTNKRSAAQLRPGDRVRERGNTGGCVANPSSPNYRAVCEILAQRREGSVISLETRRNSKGARCEYVKVCWDHLQTPSVHAAFRLERLDP